MAWDEQAEAGADKAVVIMWWRKGRPDVLSAAAKSGYDLIMAPVDYTYFDYTQARGEPGAPWEGNDNGPTSIAKVLSWEPVPTASARRRAPGDGRRGGAVDRVHRIPSATSNSWPSRGVLAFSEIAWSPKGKRDEAEFDVRLAPHLEGFGRAASMPAATGRRL